MIVSEMEYASRDIIEKYKSIEPSDLVDMGIFNAEIDAKVFIDKERKFLGIRKGVIYHKEEHRGGD